jgi:hypothetical protein
MKAIFIARSEGSSVRFQGSKGQGADEQTKSAADPVGHGPNQLGVRKRSGFPIRSYGLGGCCPF